MRQSHPLMLVILCYILTLCFCQACTDPNCLTCPTVTVCTLCNYGFALNSTTSNCSQCTASNQTIQNNFCYAIPANCQQYPINPNDNTTLICIQCNANYAFNSSTNTSCTLCNNASVTVYNNTCYNSTPNCALYQMSSTPGTLVCALCNTYYAFNYSANSSCIFCNSTNLVILNNICYTAPPNCVYQISSTNSSILICTQCYASYAFNYSANNSCIICNDTSQTIQNGTCYNSTPNCALYQMSSTPGTLVCTQCNAHYAFNYSAPTSCIKCDDASATIQNNTCYNSTLNCALY
jgi:mannose-6-phosphate isomerase-like protein (cupin superfamily)